MHHEFASGSCGGRLAEEPAVSGNGDMFHVATCKVMNQDGRSATLTAPNGPCLEYSKRTSGTVLLTS